MRRRKASKVRGPAKSRKVDGSGVDAPAKVKLSIVKNDPSLTLTDEIVLSEMMPTNGNGFSGVNGTNVDEEPTDTISCPEDCVTTINDDPTRNLRVPVLPAPLSAGIRN